jgi:hypothetical protein
MLGKRGSIVDIAFVLVAILGFAIFILIVGKVFPAITHQIGESQIGTLNASQTALNTTDAIAGRGDGLFLTIFIGLCISVLITSFFIESSPILVPIYIIAVGLLLIFSVAAEHIYNAFATNDTFSAIAAGNTVTGFIMSHLVIITIGIGVLSMILIFAKPRGNGF